MLIHCNSGARQRTVTPELTPLTSHQTLFSSTLLFNRGAMATSGINPYCSAYSSPLQNLLFVTIGFPHRISDCRPQGS